MELHMMVKELVVTLEQLEVDTLKQEVLIMALNILAKDLVDILEQL